MIGRAVVLSLAILGAGFYGSRAAGTETPPARQALAFLPGTLGTWATPVDVPLGNDALALLGVDDYVSRTYASTTSPQRVNLYVGYYASQRQGDTIHSPQNCLPGAGWQPIEGGRLRLEVNGSTEIVNRYVIQKGADRQVVLYWYQGRGRIVANEYANKFWLMLDAARLHRSNGALVRVIAPARRAAGESVADADAAAVSFARALSPHLPAYLP
ncbi:MAG: exosortase C-terminal domain/associated protein EpsI [Vicinamibacterales bacterium]